MHKSTYWTSYCHNYLYIWILVVAFFLLGCGAFRGPRITVVWDQPKVEIKESTAVRYQGIQVGEVKKIVLAGRGVEVLIELQKKYAHYVRTESTFLVHSGAGSEQSFIEVIPLNLDSAPAVDGARFQGANSDVGAKILRWTTDWKRTAIYVGLSLGAVLLLMLVSKMFFKIWVLIMCMGGGLAAAVFLTPYLQGPLGQWIPVEARPDIIAYVAAFLIGYLGATFIVSFLRAPFHSARK